MVVVQVCVGSSCHLKGSEKIVELLRQYAEKNDCESSLSLSGSFCTGQCNRLGVTVCVNGDTCVGITEENFAAFWQERVFPEIRKEKGG